MCTPSLTVDGVSIYNMDLFGNGFVHHKGTILCRPDEELDLETLIDRSKVDSSEK